MIRNRGVPVGGRDVGRNVVRSRVRLDSKSRGRFLVANAFQFARALVSSTKRSLRPTICSGRAVPRRRKVARRAPAAGAVDESFPACLARRPRLRLFYIGLIRIPCEEFTRGVGDARLKGRGQGTEFTLDSGGRNRKQAMSSNCRPNLQTGLSKAGLLRIEHDIGVQQIVRYAACGPARCDGEE